MTRLLYISVGLRTRQDTISYSFIYIVQKKTGDRETGTGTVEPGNCETVELGLGNRDWDCKIGTMELGLETGTETVELGNRGPWNSNWKTMSLAIVLY